MKLKTYLPITLALCMFASAIGQEPTYKIVRSAKVGDKHNYKVSFDLTTNMGGTATNIALTAEAEEKVTDVSPDGIITSQNRQFNTKINFNGQDMDQPDGNDTVKAKLDGTLLESKSDKPEADGPHKFRMHYIETVMMPTADVKIGESWTRHIDADSKNGNRKTDGTYTLLAIEKIGTQDYYKIKISSKETEGDLPATFEGTEWLSTADGSMGKVDANITNMPLPENLPQDIAGKVHIELKS